MTLSGNHLTALFLATHEALGKGLSVFQLGKAEHHQVAVIAAEGVSQLKVGASALPLAAMTRARAPPGGAPSAEQIRLFPNGLEQLCAERVVVAVL
jgi:hypothetical protein